MGSASNDPKGFKSTLLGSAFLMATSAIGPGFITQTSVFTEKLNTSFSFIIICSIALDIVIQLNIWRVLSSTGLRAQDLANRLIGGSGLVLSFLIAIGGLAFNIGNIGGAALGINAMFGLELPLGALISTAIAIIVFLFREMGSMLDRLTKILGIGMIGVTLYIVFSSNPPILEATKHAVAPEVIDLTAIITLVGGTVGGYISFAGVHRLLDAGITGPENIRKVSLAAVKGIALASVMRILLFLAALGVISTGVRLDPGNPAASVFESAAGPVGLRIFGFVLWCAAITSVIGCAYTSASFIKTLKSRWVKRERTIILGFIAFSACVFLIVGKPVTVLVLVGALNAFILPFALSVILLVTRKAHIIGNYKHPIVLTVAGWVTVVILFYMTINTILIDLAHLWP